MASYNIPVPETKTGGWSLAYQWQALIVVVIGSFMVMLDTTAVNIALAVWQGSQQESGARKMRTGWIPLVRRAQ